MLFLGRTIIFSLLCLFSLEFLLVYQREKSTTAATARVAFSLFLSLFYSNALMIKRTTGIENYPYTHTHRERERERKESVVRLLCVCVCVMKCGMTDKKRYKKSTKRGKTRLSFLVF
tara:strand:- start:414 stop:764 length:351 start_codon:yes stop_codon:yes gene_type:complete